MSTAISLIWLLPYTTTSFQCFLNVNTTHLYKFQFACSVVCWNTLEAIIQSVKFPLVMFNAQCTHTVHTQTYGTYTFVYIYICVNICLIGQVYSYIFNFIYSQYSQVKRVTGSLKVELQIFSSMRRQLLGFTTIPLYSIRHSVKVSLSFHTIYIYHYFPFIHVTAFQRCLEVIVLTICQWRVGGYQTCTETWYLLQVT